jgi:hypothetical protein
VQVDRREGDDRVLVLGEIELERRVYSDGVPYKSRLSHSASRGKWISRHRAVRSAGTLLNSRFPTLY